MAKNQRSDKFLLDKGYIWDEKQQCYIHPNQLTLGAAFRGPGDIEKIPAKKTSILGRPNMNDVPVADELFYTDNGCRIILTGLPAGLNGSDGLMNSHWTKGRKVRDAYIARIAALHPKSTYMEPVSIIYIRHCSKFMDWDNACASFKKIGDAIVANKILLDDSPEHIVEFIPKQVRVQQKQQHIEIIITVQ